jgi:hypothetical protein
MSHLITFSAQLKVLHGRQFDTPIEIHGIGFRLRIELGRLVLENDHIGTACHEIFQNIRGEGRL